MNKVALITGVTGQDGSYLAEFLLSREYTVCGTVRRASTFNTARIDHLIVDDHSPDLRFNTVYADLTDTNSLVRVINRIRPDEIYNLGAQSHVRVSFDIPEYTVDVTGLGTLRLLEAVRLSDVQPRIYQASSSEMFGSAPPPQSETTPFQPRSPYACAKVLSHMLCRNYSEAYGLFIASGILFNHESPRRGETFLTRKVAQAVARIKHGLQEVVYLGNLDAQRDWGYAPEYVEAMWLMLQQPSADCYVVATGETHSVREFVEEAFTRANLDWREHVKIDARYYRPTEVDVLCGNSSRIRRELGWRPRVTFRELVHLMVDAELEAVAAMRTGSRADTNVVPAKGGTV